MQGAVCLLRHWGWSPLPELELTGDRGASTLASPHGKRSGAGAPDCVGACWGAAQRDVLVALRPHGWGRELGSQPCAHGRGHLCQWLLSSFSLPTRVGSGPCWAGARSTLPSPPPRSSCQKVVLELGSALGRKPSSASEIIRVS